MTIEKRGIPSVALAEDTLANTIGRVMASAHGYPNYQLAAIPVKKILGHSVLEDIKDSEQINALAVECSKRIESILLSK